MLETEDLNGNSPPHEFAAEVAQESGRAAEAKTAAYQSHSHRCKARSLLNHGEWLTQTDNQGKRFFVWESDPHQPAR